MKKLFRKSLIKNITHSFGRFLSIFLIIFLGAAMFSGLRNTPETMKESASQALRKADYADLTYIATLGFEDKDVSTIQKVKGVEKVEAGYQFDALYEENKAKKGVTVYSLNSFNKPTLKWGRMCKSDDEVIIDRNIVTDHINLNKTIKLSNDQGEKEYKIVGIVEDVRYISSADRGTNTLGDGRNSGFIEMTPEGAKKLAINKSLKDLRDNNHLYNTLSVKVKDSEDYNIFNDDYDDYIETINSRIRSSLSSKFTSLYDDLTGDLGDELDKAEEKYKKSLADYNKSEKDFKTKTNDAKIQILKAKIKLNEQKKKYYASKAKMNDGMSDYASKLKELGSSIETLRNSLNSYVASSAMQDQATSSKELTSINTQLVIVSKYIESTSELLKNSSTLDKAKLQLDQAELVLDDNSNKLELSILEGNSKLESGKERLDDAKAQLAKAKKEVGKIPKGTIYTITKNENLGLISYSSNVTAIDSIATVFPLIFFLVAALVSLTTMTRMVDSQREYCGTLRALGYSKKDVIMQYVDYALLATLPAALLGIIFGNQFFPRLIVFLYKYMMFKFNGVVVSQSWLVTVLTILISAGVTTAVTLIVCMQELTHMPSVLMRPKAPKAGKRIFLEKIGFVWRRLSFNRKVTFRNIFRYKARFLMSIIGIAGCTGLIITGFGIKDSVSEIIDYQYKDVYHYDGMIHLKKQYQDSDVNKVISKLEEQNTINDATLTHTSYIHMLGNKQDLDTQLVVYNTADEIKKFINFEDVKTSSTLSLDEKGVVISQKASELLDVEEGDTLKISIDDEKVDVSITGVMKNYYGHYCYMDKELYTSLTSSSFKTNSGFINMINDKKSTKNSIDDYFNDKNLGSIEYISEMGSDFSMRLDSLNIVIAVLIIFAGLLDFIVLYNLTNINIEERKREIATIKVLGFRRREFYDYIFRENYLLSIVGGILGFGLGIALHRFIIFSVEFDQTIFGRTIHLPVLLIAFAITLIFTFLINLSMRHVLRNVDMVESLKSIE